MTVEKKYKMLLVILAAALLTAPPTGSTKDRCLHVCSCTGPADQIDVKCPDLPEGRWPGIYPLNTSTLDLSGNALHNVTASSLQGKGLDHLTSLKLSNCRLSSIDSQAFQGFRWLTSLDLTFNNIIGLTADHFKDLESLQVLRLTGYDRHECRMLRAALPEVTVHCGSHVKTSTSTREPSVSPKTKTPTPTPTPTPVTLTPRTTVTATPTSSTPRYTETPATSTVTPIADCGGVSSGSAVVIGVACFVLGALAMVLGQVAAQKWRWWGAGRYEQADAGSENEGKMCDTCASYLSQKESL